jgi:hypothetical protein
MGIHESDTQPEIIVAHGELAMITIQCWSALDRTMIAASALYATEQGQVRRNIGGDILDYRILSMPTLSQVVYCLGDEIKSGWRELSTPKR